MPNNIRSLGGMRIGMLAIAFTGPDQKDAFGNYWTRDTDLAMQRYDKRPLYFKHKGAMVEAGYIFDEDIVIREDGLWVESDLLENEAGFACRDLVLGNRAFASTGCMPGSWTEGPDGFVSHWPWVEDSITDRPATRNGLTRAGEVRESLNLEGDGDMNMFLDRGPIWFSDGISLTPDDAPAYPVDDAVALPTAAEFAAMRQSLASVTTSLETVQASNADLVARLDEYEPATRHLPDDLPLPLASPQGLSVSHWYDEMSLSGLALWGNLRWMGSEVSPRKLAFPGDKRTELIRALQSKIEKQMSVDNRLTDMQLMRGHRRMLDHEMMTDWGPFTRADEVMKTDFTNFGSDLIPTLLNTILWYFFMSETRVLNALPAFQLPHMNFEWPTVTSGSTIRKVAEISDQDQLNVANSAIPVSLIGTDKIVFSPGKIGAMVLASIELFNDSAVGVAQMWSTQLIRDIASAIDYVLINGDEDDTVTNISHYGAAPSTDQLGVYDKILQINGLRKMAKASTQTVADVTVDKNAGVGLRKLMGARGKYGMNAKDLIEIVDPNIWYDMLELEAIESVADVNSDMATLLTGMVGSLKGVPLIAADELEATNDAGNIEDSHDGAKASQLMVNKNMVKVGWWRNVETEMMRVAGAEGYFVDIIAQLDLQEMQVGAVSYAYNTTVS